MFEVSRGFKRLKTHCASYPEIIITRQTICIIYSYFHTSFNCILIRYNAKIAIAKNDFNGKFKVNDENKVVSTSNCD